jgi:vacuolar-type H+-ATPase subunit E/Vma4
MDAQAILTKIEQDAKEAAKRIRSEAEEKARVMKIEAGARIETLEKTMLAQAERDCEQMEERMRRMADLDDRKQMLRQKREVIDEAFQTAMEKLERTKPAERRAFFLRQVAKCAGGEETLIVGADGAGWFDDGFPADADKALIKAGKPGKLKPQARRRKGCAGVVLAKNGAEIRIAFDTLLDEARAELEQSAARTLFTQ